MKYLQHWFSRQQSKNKRFKSIEDMILGDNIAAYAEFRLNYFNLQLLIRFLSHVFFTYFLFRSFTFSPYLLWAIGFVVAKFVITGVWWGGLEVLRTKVRYSYRNKDRNAAGESIGRWLVISGGLSVILLLVFIGLLAYSFSPFLDSHTRYFVIYIATIVAVLAIQIPIRTFHSGIYAISRIVRPAYSLILADVAFISTLLVAWPWMHYYALPMGMVVRAIISQMLTYYYAKRMYAFHDLYIAKPSKKLFFKKFKKFPFSDFMLGALGNALIYSENILILILLALHRNLIQQDVFLYLIFLILPLIRACSEWARLFYFDWKRQENDDFAIFRGKFEKQISRITPFVGGFYWLLACISAFAVISTNALFLCVLLLPYFLLRSKISILQMRCFAKYEYYAAILSGLLLVVGYTGIYLLPIDPVWQAGLLAVALLLVYGYLHQAKHKVHNQVVMTKRPLHIYAWLNALSHVVEKKAVQIHRLRIPAHVNDYQRFHIAERMIRYFLKSQDQLCFYGDQLFFFRLYSPTRDRVDLRRLSLLSAGLIDQYHEILIKDKKDFFAGEFIKSLLFVDNVNQAETFASTENLKIRFFEKFPDGICFDPNYCAGPQAALLSDQLKRQVRYFANQYLYFPQKEESYSQYFVSVYYVPRHVSMIFLIPKQQGDGELWRKEIDELSKTVCLLNPM